MAIRLAIADDHELVRSGLVLFLGSVPDIEIAADASSGDALLDKLRSGKVDLVLLDFSMPGRDGLSLIPEIKRLYPRLPILVLSAHYDVQSVLSAMRAGASGYISKNSSPQTLLEAVREVIAKGKYLSQDMADQLAQAWPSAQPKHDKFNSKKITLGDEAFDIHESDRHLRQAQSISHVGSWDYDLVTGQLAWTDELYRIYGVFPETFSPGIENLIKLIHPHDQASMRTWIAECASTQKPKALEFRCVWPDGTIHYIESQGELFMDADGKPSFISGTAQDITERKQIAEHDIRQLAFYDPLTQLPNRRLLMDRLRRAMAISMRSGHHGALMFLDIDRFKTINDTQGHAVGDLLLIEVACRLQSCVREGDSVARFGGDEFVVVLEELSLQEDEAVTQAEWVAEKIRDELSKPYVLNDYECRTSPSIGVCLFRGHLENQEDLLRHADIAMYQAKAAGRNAVRFFDPHMQTALDARLAMETDLGLALARQQLHLHYQIQVDSLIVHWVLKCYCAGNIQSAVLYTRINSFR